MAYEFKKLSDVAAVEVPADTANVLIEEDGVIKKVAKGEVGGVKVASTAEVGQTIVVKAIDENGNPTEWECADLATQPDWNQNDPEAKDYIKNRTHWSAEPVRRVIYPEMKIEHDGGNSFQTYLPVGDGEFFVAGKKYEVIFDGVKYPCTAFVSSPHNIPVVMLGANYNESFEESDYPFWVYIEPPDYDSTFENSMYFDFEYTLSEPFTHTIEVAEIVEEVHTIDTKYLPQPDMVITVNELIDRGKKPSLSDVSTTSGSFEVLHDIILAGRVPNVVVRFCKNSNHIDEYYQVEATELKASVYWYGSGAAIKTVANDYNNRLICYKFTYSEGELIAIEMRYHDGTEVS